jgi:hypothetical protein
VARLWHTKSFIREGGSKKHRFVPYAEIVENDYDLSPSFHLSGHQYPHSVPLRPLSELFEISKGTIPAASANDGSYTFITSSEEPRRFDQWTKEGEAICIPTVSATGHGHASIKTIHYVNGKFAASTITAVLMKAAPVHVPFVYYYLLAHKDELLVPLMRGAANVSLSLERLARLRVPVPSSIKEQKGFVRNLSKGNILTAEVRSKLSQAESAYKQDLEEFRSNF